MHTYNFFLYKIYKYEEIKLKTGENPYINFGGNKRYSKDTSDLKYKIHNQSKYTKFQKSLTY